MIHEDDTSFYVQGSTDFVICAHRPNDVLLEKILETANSKLGRDAWQRERNHAALAVPDVNAVPGAVPAVPAVASNYFDTDEKQQVQYQRTQWGLEVKCGRVPRDAMPSSFAYAGRITEVPQVQKSSSRRNKHLMVRPWANGLTHRCCFRAKLVF